MTIHAREDPDGGFSLVELIIYTLLATLLLGTMAMILINSWRTQKSVTSASEATNTGQLMGSAVERAMRNALAFDVDDTGTILRVRTSLGGALACQAFLLSSGQARITTSAGALSTNTNNWSNWASSVAQDGSTPFFTESGDSVTYSFAIKTTSSAVRFSGDAAARSVATGVTSPCW